MFQDTLRNMTDWNKPFFGKKKNQGDPETTDGFAGSFFGSKPVASPSTETASSPSFFSKNKSTTPEADDDLYPEGEVPTFDEDEQRERDSLISAYLHATYPRGEPNAMRQYYETREATRIELANGKFRRTKTHNLKRFTEDVRKHRNIHDFVWWSYPQKTKDKLNKLSFEEREEQILKKVENLKNGKFKYTNSDEIDDRTDKIKTKIFAQIKRETQAEEREEKRLSDKQKAKDAKQAKIQERENQRLEKIRLKEEKAAQKKEQASIRAEEADIARQKKQEAAARKSGKVRGSSFVSVEWREQKLAERKNPEIKKQRDAAEIKRRTRIRNIYADLYQEA